MKNLNYSKLQPLSKNTDQNKKNKAEKSTDCLLALLDYQSNFEEAIRNMSIYDATSLIIAEQDWLKRNKYTSFKGSSLSKGQMCKVDFGKTYSKENAFIHYALIVGKYKGKVLVIPSTTSPDEINIAYHPTHNPSGEYRLRLAHPSEGFSSKAAFFMNDAKFISQGRILEVKESINPVTFEEIQIHLIKVMFPDFYKNTVQALESENTTLLSTNEQLQDEIKNLKLQVENLNSELKNLSK